MRRGGTESASPPPGNFFSAYAPGQKRVPGGAETDIYYSMSRCQTQKNCGPCTALAGLCAVRCISCGSFSRRPDDIYGFRCSLPAECQHDLQDIGRYFNLLVAILRFPCTPNGRHVRCSDRSKIWRGGGVDRRRSDQSAS